MFSKSVWIGVSCELSYIFNRLHVQKVVETKPDISESNGHSALVSPSVNYSLWLWWKNLSGVHGHPHLNVMCLANLFLLHTKTTGLWLIVKWNIKWKLSDVLYLSKQKPVNYWCFSTDAHQSHDHIDVHCDVLTAIPYTWHRWNTIIGHW